MIVKPWLAGLVVLLPLLPGSAFAINATAAQNVNVRSGPAGSFGVVAQLQRGDAVDISKCQGTFCYITFGANKGWVSANYLTRDSVPKAPTTLIPAGPQIAAAKPASPQSTITTKPLPKIAATAPRTPTNANDAVSVGSLPPAYAAKPAPDVVPAPNYADGAAPFYGDNATGPAGDNSDQGYADAGPAYGSDQGPAMSDNGNGSRVVLPPDDGNVIASTNGPDVPRPKVDIPEAAPAMDDNADNSSAADVPEAGATDYGPAAASGGDWGPAPRDGWRNHFGPGARFADLSDYPGHARACFFGEDGGRFCLGAGQSRDQFGNWSEHIASIVNPRGLRVTICSTGGMHDCRVYESSGPVLLPGDAAVASISVDPPAGY